MIFTNNGIQDLAYKFNKHTGNLEFRQDKSKNLIENFEYDSQNRLINYQVNNSTLYEQTYTNNGNIDTKTELGKYEYKSNKPNAVTGVENPNGLISGDRQIINYTKFNKISHLSQANKILDFVYGNDYQRRKSIYKENGQLKKTKYFIGAYEEEIENGYNKRIHYISGGNGLCAIKIMNVDKEELYTVHKDHLGSIQTLTKKGGKVAEFNFDPWGRQRTADTWQYLLLKVQG